MGSRSGWAGLQSRGEKKLERGGQQRRTVPQPGPVGASASATAGRQHAEPKCFPPYFYSTEGKCAQVGQRGYDMRVEKGTVCEC